MRPPPIVLSMVTLLLGSQAAFCASYCQLGVRAYQKNDYKNAIKLFESGIHSGSQRDPDAHYYLGNCLYKTGRPADALKEYEISLGLNSTSRTAEFCKSAIAAIKDEQSLSSVGAKSAAKAPPAVKIDDSAVVAALPKVPSSSSEHPSSFEVKQWTDPLRAQYLNQAISRVPELQEKLRQAQDLLQQAQLCTNALTQVAKKKGETDAIFKRRVQAGQTRANQLLKPYEEYVANCQQFVNDAKTVVEACRVADKKLNR